MDYTLVNTAQGIEDALGSFNNSVAVGLDIETLSLAPRDGEISLIQLSDGEKTFVVDTIELDGRYTREAISKLTMEDKEEFWKSYVQAESLKLFIPFLEADKPRKVVQNLKFEAVWFQEKLGCEINGAFDTYLAGKLLDMPADAKLDALLERYLKITVSKEEQKSDWSGKLTKEQLEYAARDAVHLPALREIQVNLLRQNGMVEVAAIEFNAVRAVAKMEAVGFPIDTKMYRELVDELIIRRDVRAKELENELNKAMGYVVTTKVQGGLWGDDKTIITGGINLNSPNQVTEAFKRLGVELPSTNKQTINNMVGKYPQLKYLTDYRAEQILVTAFGEKIINIVNKETGRIHASFWQIKAATARFASSNPNLQQMPGTKEFRQCFRPTDSDRVFIICVDENTRISTDKGLLKIKDIAINDSAVQENKGTKTITRVIPKGVQPTKIITLVDGYEITATNTHRLRVIDKAGNYVWKKVSEITSDDFVALCGNTITNELEYIKLPQVGELHWRTKRLNLTTSVLDERLSEFFGYLVGDGSFAYNTTKFVVNYQDEDLFNYLHTYAESLTGKKLPRRDYRGVIESGVYSVYMSSLLKGLDINKEHISDYIFKSKRSVIASFLRGLFEADGCVSGEVSYSSSREQIVKDVQILLLGLGIFSHKYTQIYTVNNKKFIGYTLTIKSQSLDAFKNEIGFISNRKKDKLSQLFIGNRVFKLGFPNLKSKFKEIKLKKTDSSAYRNIKTLNRQLSNNSALLFKQDYPDLFNELEIYRLTDYNQIFLPIQTIEDSESIVYDLTVSDTSTYIGNGFINHNCDYGAIELRILAQISQDPVMIDAFNNKKDLHSITAIAAFNLPCTEKEVKTLYPERRAQAKCFHPDVEFLTKKGWCRFKDISENTEIIQAIPSDGVNVKLEWVLPTEWYSFYHESNQLTHLKNEGIDIQVTPDHRMLGWSDALKPKIVTPENLEKCRYWANSGILEESQGIEEDKKLLKLVVATQADGSYHGEFIRFGFTKERKIERLRTLLYGFNYTEFFNGKVTTFTLKDADIIESIKKYLGATKEFTTDLLNLTLSNRRCVLNELRYWDGHKANNWRMSIFSNTSKQSVDAIQALCSISNIKSSCSYKDRTGRKRLYTLSIRDTNKTRGGNLKVENIVFKDKVVCVSVPSSYILVRQNGKPIIVGQSLNFGVVYGIGANKYADNTGITPTEAKKAIRGFYDTYKGVEKYLYAIEDFGIKNRHVRTLAGRKLQLYFDPSNEKEISMARRNARNYPIQSSSADILKLALGVLYPRLTPYRDAYIVNIVHDEIIIECNRKDAEDVKSILSESMLEAAYTYLPDIFVEAEANIAESWAEK